MLHVIALAQYAIVYTRSWAANSGNARVRLRAENDRLRQDVALLRAETRIKDARMARIPPHRRPQYLPAERLEILALRGARGWSLKRTADAFLVTAATIASWMNRVDEAGPEPLVQLRTPVNRFPDFVRYAVQELKTLCPSLGNKKLAEVLARAGLHLGATTIGRMRKEPAKPAPKMPDGVEPPQTRGRAVTAKRPNHVWHIDLTVLPTGTGHWCSWLPWALPQCWPFCWWLAIVVDHYSRRAMGFAIFRRPPSGVEIRAFLGRTMHAAGAAPKHLISDKGAQFWPSRAYKRWCKRCGIKPRFGAIGRHGSIAVVERLIKTIKSEGLRSSLLPYHREAMRARCVPRSAGTTSTDRTRRSAAGPLTRRTSNDSRPTVSRGSSRGRTGRAARR